MNRSLLLGILCASAGVVAASCSQEGPTPVSANTGGTVATTGGSTAASGAPSSGGANTMVPGTGGSSPGSGGASAGTTGGVGSNTGGSSATTGGSVGTGGSSASGGSTANTGGSNAGAAGAATGGTSSSGGASNTGGSAGSSTGGANTGGSAGSGTGGASNTGGSSTGGSGTAGAAGGVSVASLVPSLDGYLWVGTCAAGASSGLDCPINDDANKCPNTNAASYAQRGAFKITTHNVAGTPGTKYMINFEVRGVAGGRCYTKDPAFSGLRSTTLIADPEGPAGNDGWFVGGTPTDSKWNTYEIRVDPPVPGEANVYYLNAFPTTSGLCERHETFVFKYSASFAVLGGGTIKTVIHDSNCLGQQNCGGVDNQATCANPRSVDLTGMSPPPPASFTQPLTQGNFHPQWLFVDVKSVSGP